jgi:hypothetical protein
MRDLARFVLALAIQTEVPSANLVKPPDGKTTVEVPPELDGFKETIRASAGEWSLTACREKPIFW